MSDIQTGLRHGAHLYVEGKFLRCLSRINDDRHEATVVLQHLPLGGRRSGKVLLASLSDLLELERAGLAALIQVGPSSAAPVPTRGRGPDGDVDAASLALA